MALDTLACISHSMCQSLEVVDGIHIDKMAFCVWFLIILGVSKEVERGLSIMAGIWMPPHKQLYNVVCLLKCLMVKKQFQNHQRPRFPTYSYVQPTLPFLSIAIQFSYLHLEHPIIYNMFASPHVLY